MVTVLEKNVWIQTPIGKLEAKLTKGDGTKTFGIIFCCPHPIYSGTMDMELISGILTQFITAGYPTLRFNYRGKGNSEGSYGRGLGERMDVRNVIHYFLSLPAMPGKICLIGYSFGAAIGTSIVSEFEEILGYVAISYPYPINPVYLQNASVPKPKLFIWGDADKVINASALNEAFEEISSPKTKIVIPGARHSWKEFEDKLITSTFSWVHKSLL